jgi:hypothetical protein
MCVCACTLYLVPCVVHTLVCTHNIHTVWYMYRELGTGTNFKNKVHNVVVYTNYSVDKSVIIQFVYTVMKKVKVKKRVLFFYN